MKAKKLEKTEIVKQLISEGFVIAKYESLFRSYRKKVNSGNRDLLTTKEKEVNAMLTSFYRLMKKGMTLEQAFESYAPKGINTIDKIGRIQGAEFAEAIRSCQRKRDSKTPNLITDYERYCHSIYQYVKKRIVKGMDLKEALEEAIEYAEDERFVDTVFPDPKEKAELYEADKQRQLGGIESCDKRQKELVNKYQREYKAHKIATDEIHAKKQKMKGATLHGFRGDFKKNSYTAELLGCDYETAITHVESTNPELDMLDGYNVHIDHVMPMKLADTEREAEILSYYMNFQLLTATDNLSKSGWLPEFHDGASVKSKKNSYVLMLISYFNYTRYSGLKIKVNADKQTMQIEQWSEMAA